MADATITLGFDTRASLSELDRTLSNFERSRKLNFSFDSSAITKGANSLDALDKSIQKTQTHFAAFAATSIVLGSIATSFEKMVTEAVRFEAELAKINISLNTSSSQLKSFGGQLFQIARDTGNSFDEVSKAAQQFAVQGLSMNETLKRTKDALTLTRISGSELSESIEIITSTIKEFNKESLTSTDVINKLASGQGKYAVSTQTLAEAIKKVGPVANEAGISLDKLIGLVTSVAATTQQSGDRIGTAFTQIFNSTQKQGTIEALRNVGIQVEKIPGQYLPVLDILKNVSAQYDNLSQAQQKQVSNLLGGTRQLSILLALLGDVNKAYGTAAQATNTAAQATDNAARKNAELNKTLAAQANAALQTIEQFASKAGSLTFGPLLKNLFSGLQSGAGIINGSDIGKKIGEGILSGIGQVLSGPGLVIGGAVIASLIKKVIGVTASSLNSLLTVNGATSTQKDLQAAINQELKNQGITYQQLLSLDKSRISANEALLNIIKQQSAAQIGSEALSNTFANVVSSAGGRSRGGVITFADGYLPDALQNESTAISQGVGEAYGASPVVVPNFSIGGRPQTVVANNKEFLVPTTSINPGYSGPDKTSIINPEMVNKLGGLPSGAIPIASEGLIPNFAIGDLIGQGVQSNILDAGSLVFKQSRGSHLGQHKTARGLQFLQALINQDEGLQSLGLKAHAPVPNGNVPRALRNLFNNDTGFFQQKLEGFKYATPQKAREIESAIDGAIENHGTNSRKGFSSFQIGDLARNPSNILIDKDGNPNVIDLLPHKSESYRKILRKKKNYAEGFTPGSQEDLQRRLIGLEAYDNLIKRSEILQRKIERAAKRGTFNKSLEQEIESFHADYDAFDKGGVFNGILASDNISQATQSAPPQISAPVQSILANEPRDVFEPQPRRADGVIPAPRVISRVTPEQTDTFLRDAANKLGINTSGIKLASTLREKIQAAEAQGAQVQSAQPPPLPNIVSPVSSVVNTSSIDPETVRQQGIAQLRALGDKGVRDNFTQSTINRRLAGLQGGGNAGLPPNTPIAPPAPSAPTPPNGGSGNSSGSNSSILHQEALKFGIDISDNPSDSVLRQRIIDVNKFLGIQTPSHILNFGQPSTFDAKRAGGVSQLFNRSNVDLLNSSRNQALPLDGPAIRKNIRGELQKSNNLLGKPLDNLQLDSLVEEELSKNVVAYVKEGQKQLANVGKSKQTLKNTLASITIQSGATSIATQVQQAISNAEDLTPKQIRDYRRSVGNSALQSINPEDRNNPQVKATIAKIQDQALENVLNQIQTGKQNIARNNVQTDFINGFNQSNGGIFNNLNGRKTNNRIDEFVRNQVSLGGSEQEAQALANGLRMRERQNQIQRRSQIGLGVAFGAPIVVGGIVGALGDNISSRQRDLLTGGTTALSTGAAIASLNPSSRSIVGLGAIASAAGLGLTIARSFQPIRSEDTALAADNFRGQAANRNQTVNEYLQAQDQVHQIVAQGGNPQQVRLVQQAAARAFNQIPDSQLKAQLIGKDADSQRQIAFQSSSSDDRRQASLNFDNLVANINDKGGALGSGRTAFLGASRLLGNKDGNDANIPFLSLLGKGSSIDRFAGEQGKDLLNQTINSLIQSGKGETGLKQLTFDAGLTKKEAQEAQNLYDKLTKVTDAFDSTANAANKAQLDLADFNKRFTLALSSSVFRTGFNAQSRFNQNQNSIDTQLNTLNNEAEFTNQGAFIGANSALQVNSINNQAGLAQGQALSETLNDLNKAFTNKDNLGSDDSNGAAKEIIDAIKNGSLTGDEALKSLDKIITTTQGTTDSNLGLKDQLIQIKQNLSDKLTTISQNTKDQIDKNEINTKKFQDALSISNTKNFGGGLNSFLNPSSFRDLTNPITSGLNTNSNIFNQTRPFDLTNFALRRLGGTASQNDVSRNINDLTAQGGRANFGIIKSLQGIFGEGFDDKDQTPFNGRVEKGFEAQNRNNIASQVTKLFSTLPAGDGNRVFQPLLGNIQNQFNKGILNGNVTDSSNAFLRFDKVLSGITNPESKQQFQGVEDILKQIVQNSGNIKDISKKQADIFLGNQGTGNINTKAGQVGNDVTKSLAIQAETVSLSVSNLDSLAKALKGITDEKAKNDADLNVKASGQFLIKVLGGIDPDQLDEKIQQAILDYITKGIKPEAQIPQPPKNLPGGGDGANL